MATTTTDALNLAPPRIGVLRLALTGAISAALFYIFCWIGALITSFGSHMYVQLFTGREVTSIAALVEGAILSLGFGLITGAIIALVYNALGNLDRR